MIHRRLLTSAALAALLWTPVATAQTQRPVPTPTPRQTPAPSPRPSPNADQRYSMAWYLNHGDYASAAELAEIHNRDEYYRANVLNYSAYYALVEFGGPIESGQVVTAMSQFEDRAGYILTIADLPPPQRNQGAGAAQSSLLYTGGMATLNDFAYQQRGRIDAIQALQREARATGDTSLIARTGQLYLQAQQTMDNIRIVQEIDSRYRGHFPSESIARTYIAAREAAIDDIATLNDRRIPVVGTNGQLATFREIANGIESELTPYRANAGRNQNPLTFAADDLVSETLVRQAQRFRGPQGGGDGPEAAARRSGFQGRQDPVLRPGSPENQQAAQAEARRRAAANSAENDAAIARILAIRQRNEAAYGNTSGADGARQAGSAGANAAREATAGNARPPAPQRAANEPPPQIPTAPDYPTARRRTPAEIAASQAQAAARRAASTTASETQRAAAQAAAREAAERLAMIERARVNDENYRLFQAALRQNAQDSRWAQMIRERFGNGAWDAFANGQVLTVLQLEEIYRDYDLDRSPVIPPARSLSAAGRSLSAAGRSLSAAGTAVVTGFDDYRDPAVQSFYEATRLLTSGRYGPGGQASNAELANAVYNMGDYDIYSDPTGRAGREGGGYILASLYSQQDEYLRYLTANGLSGLDALLAQPFNVLLTWGAGAYDLDLHMTGPTGEGSTDRFHIYYSAPGKLDDFPFAQLIKDCICSSGSEVVLTSALLRGGVYRVSVFNFGDQSATSNVLSNRSNAQLQIVRGGTAVSVGNGTTIEGGRTIATIPVPVGQPGNTWVAAELDPRSGRIRVPGTIVQTDGVNNVP